MLSNSKLVGDLTVMRVLLTDSGTNERQWNAYF